MKGQKKIFLALHNRAEEEKGKMKKIKEKKKRRKHFEKYE